VDLRGGWQRGLPGDSLPHIVFKKTPTEKKATGKTSYRMGVGLRGEKICRNLWWRFGLEEPSSKMAAGMDV